MADPASAEEKLATLRELVLRARSVPMSASCLVNRGQVLRAIDEVVQQLPGELAEAQRVIDQAQAKVAEGAAAADRMVAQARSEVSRLAEDTEVVKVAEAMAASLKTEAEREAAALRREADVFIDGRMAGFESALHQTASQVRTARQRLSERSSLD